MRHIWRENPDREPKRTQLFPSLFEGNVETLRESPDQLTFELTREHLTNFSCAPTIRREVTARYNAIQSMTR